MRQLEMRLPTHGGKRKGAGRKPAGRKAGVSHRPRHVDPNAPLHVTTRVLPHVWSMRGKKTYAVIRRAMVQGCRRFGFRLVHHSVQGNHIHMVCEATDRRALGRGIKGLNVRIARRLNSLMERKGPVMSDRYHSRPLRTPSEVKNCLAYVLKNAEVHAARSGVGRTQPFDECSSALWFDGWKRPLEARCTDEPPGTEPRSWLMRVGWKRRGLL
jgi:REP element-mobilizing transposase RayT